MLHKNKKGSWQLMHHCRRQNQERGKHENRDASRI